MVDISIIVPAYNVEKYLEKCLDSLVNQTKKEIEIIIVNDGSSDSTGDIIQKYSELYPEKIVPINQENAGQSVARNNAIKLSKGRYIAFVDSDDHIKENMFEILFNKACEGDYDVVACNVDCIYPQKTVPIQSGVSIESDEITDEQSKELLLNMYAVLWNKIYKRELFENGELLLEPGIWFEDVLFCCKLVPNIKSIAFVEDRLYNYIQRENSVTYTYSEKLLDIHKVVNKILEYYKEKGLYEKYLPELEYIYVRYMLATYIKRLAKSRDRKKFSSGVSFARETVKNTFPDYKNNIYLNNGSKKGLYLKHFNSFLANLIYIIEKNRMN